MLKITFQPDEKTVEAVPGTTLLKVAEASGILIDASCGGAGSCGKCKVQICAGDAGTPTPQECSLLSPQELSDGYRLACMVQAQSDLTVYVPGAHGGSTRKKRMAVLPETFTPERHFQVEVGRVCKATMQDQSSDLHRLAACFGRPGMTLAPKLLPQIYHTLRASGGAVSGVFQGDTLIDLIPGEQAAPCYGVAFDVGTTTVVGMLWDLKDGTLREVAAKTNYQTVYGSDVISRIQFCTEAPEHLALIQEKIIACFNDILAELCAASGVDPRSIYDAVVVGNTTMSHLVLGVNPRALSRTPFAPVFTGAQTFRADDLGIGICPRAQVLTLPNIAGHVGSDIVGMMLAVNMDALPGCHIAIDIGTNGEIVAIKDGQMVTCSTAAGPAFEGARIRQGMRAAAGAIEQVRFTEQSVELKTIDDAPPIGICGSGLIDAVAQLLEWGLMPPNGRLLNRAEAEAAGLPPALCKRILQTEEGRAFVLSYVDTGDNICLTQQDIREVQLGKGAILAGVYTLMRTLKMRLEEVDSIRLAGAFGNYIRRESALRIGLLPQVSLEKIIPVGNAAGAGASMALLSRTQRQHAEQMARQTRHVELSMNMDFQEFYMGAMTFDIKTPVAL